MDKQVRKIRIQRLEEQGDENDLNNTTPIERLEMMWQLALNAWAFKGEKIAEQRLLRHVVRLYRGEG
jgi:hypothetical protein